MFLYKLRITKAVSTQDMEKTKQFPICVTEQAMAIIMPSRGDGHVAFVIID